MNAEATLERVAAALEGIAHERRASRDGLASIALARERVREALERLRRLAGFESSTFVTAIDRLPAVPRFEVVWQLRSFAHGDRLRLCTAVPEEDPRVPSTADLWPGASYSERECWDMFGIRFEGHPDLRRLLMPEEYGHHPLRKDFPHQGIEPDRLYREWDRQRRAAWAAGGAQ